MAPWTPSRRDFLSAFGALGLGAVAAACTKSSPQRLGPLSIGPHSINSLEKGATQLSMLNSTTPTNPGKQRFAFDLATSQSQLVTGGSPGVWLAKDQNTQASGPFHAKWYEFTGYAKTNDRSPKSPFPGTYVAEIDLASEGNWFIAATLTEGSSRATGAGAIPVTTGRVPAQIGRKATSVKTPVAMTTSGLKQICTRIPVCHLHSISLDEAITSGRPTAISFSTPLLCQSQTCGPSLDELILTSEKLGPNKVNFVHVEEFLPGPKLKPPLPTLENQSPGFKAWGLQTEPWTILVGRDGVIRWRAEGTAAAAEIERALRQLI